MNIKITHNWLLEYLETNASPEEIRDYLSLAGPSVESVVRFNSDWIYDIEVISNRVDYASIVGIAREAAAILPRFGKTAKLKLPKYLKQEIGSTKEKLTIVDEKNLCPLKLAVVMEVKIGESPNYIKERLESCGIRSLNNLIDVTNYVMIETGHPAHVFDFDRVKTGKIVIRKAKKGEKIVTLDGIEHILSSDETVFDDGSGRLIDLPGIMGLENSAVVESTKKIILWIESNDPSVIRKTTMNLGIRTLAASYNEKRPDINAAYDAFYRGIELYENIASGKIISQVYITEPKPALKKIIVTDYFLFEKIMGVKLPKEEVRGILNNLGFVVEEGSDNQLKVVVPSYRLFDISIPEDLVEEVARIYGYHQLPSNLPPAATVFQPEDFEKLFGIIFLIKQFLKHLGLTEMINYSMISKSMILEGKGIVEDHIKLANTISDEIEFMRISLKPSLHKNISENKGKRKSLRLFEIGKVYPRIAGDLPNETYRLGIATNTDYFDLKGIIEALYKELGIYYQESDINILEDYNNEFYTEIDLRWLIDEYRPFPKYRPISPYAVIKLDKTFDLSDKLTFEKIKEKAFRSQLLKYMEVVGLFKNKLTVRFFYTSPFRNLTEEEALKELDF